MTASSTDPGLVRRVNEVLRRFNELVGTRDPRVLDEFAPGEEVSLVGSEPGEVAVSRQALERFFSRAFARAESFAWEWHRLEAWREGDIAWFYAEGRVLMNGPEGQRSGPYCLTGILQRQGGRWLWRHYHGAEPVSGE